MSRLRANAWDARSPTTNHESIAELESWINALAFKSFKSMIIPSAFSFNCSSFLINQLRISWRFFVKSSPMHNKPQMSSLQKKSFDLQCLLRFQDHCPQERLSQDKKPLDDCPLDKCPLVKLPSSNNSSFDKSPKWLRPGWLLTKKVALEEICPTPGQLAPKKIALPLYNCFPRKFSSKKTPRQLPPWMLASGQFSTKKTPLKVTAPTPYNPPR